MGAAYCSQIGPEIGAKMARMLPDGDDRQPPPVDDVANLVGHPRGTLALVLILAALFALGWFGMFLFRFMERGAPHH